MLKKIYKKKLLICSIVMFAIFLIYLIPSDNKQLNIEEELNYVNKNVNTSTIFLLDSKNYLASTKIITKNTSIKELALELINALIIDGNLQDNIPSGFKALIPSETKINSLEIYNDLIKIDFSNKLLDTTINNEEKIIESIVYTLTSIDKINKVIIFIDGKVLTTLPKSKITLPTTLDRSYGINKEYNINSTKNISKTTIYYISEFNNLEYYVPVTKINNDNRNKIEIIIDELSSNNVYKTNLMSYLNSNTKVISTNQIDDELIINFNSAIFNDINNKEILEEVIYTISLSIYDNYNINTVVFNVEDEEIYKYCFKENA